MNEWRDDGYNHVQTSDFVDWDTSSFFIVNELWL